MPLLALNQFQMPVVPLVVPDGSIGFGRCGAAVQLGGIDRRLSVDEVGDHHGRDQQHRANE